MDPIYPGQELPLPLHLAEAGRLSWRPIGNSYLWSEYYNLSNLLSQDSKIGFLKSFACYPLHASGDPFRCCVSVRDIGLHSSSRLKKTGQILHNLDDSKKRFVHQVTLNTPLVVNSYLPEAVSLTIESSGVTRTAFLSEVCGLVFYVIYFNWNSDFCTTLFCSSFIEYGASTQEILYTKLKQVETFFHHIDPSHDLRLEIHMQRFKPLDLKFPRMEKFCSMAKFSGTKFSLSEYVTFYPDSSNGTGYSPIYLL